MGDLITEKRYVSKNLDIFLPFLSSVGKMVSVLFILFGRPKSVYRVDV